METFLATLGQVVMRVFEMHGVDGRALLQEAGVDLTLLRDPAARIPSSTADVVYARAATLISDPAFALRAARCWHPSNLGVLGHAWLASSTLRTGLNRLERHGRILGDKAQIQIEDTRNGLRLLYDHRRRDPLLRAVGADLALSMIVDMCRMNYGASLRPVEVRLTRAKPENPEPWKYFYGCPIHFHANEDSFLLSPRVADEVLPTANRQLAGTLDSILAAQLAALNKDSVAARCKFNLLEQLTSGELSAEEIAQQLHMSRRTLQRKLSEVDTTYEQLVDDTRREVALRYMDDTTKSVTEVTFLLGFSGPSAFSRAFKRWTGVSPMAYREKKKAKTA